MKLFKPLTNLFFSILCTLIFNSLLFAEPANLGVLMKEVSTYHDSGDYLKEQTGIIQQARAQMLYRVQVNARSAHPKKLAIVLDIDETSLSNYQDLLACHFTCSKTQLHRMVLAAHAPTIKAMLSFYNEALAKGIAIFFVTGRREADRAQTIKNLKMAGYHDWAGLYLKPMAYNHPSAIPFKSQTRAAICKQGYTIIASIGDQQSDLAGGSAEKTFKLPNPYYWIP